MVDTSIHLWALILSRCELCGSRLMQLGVAEVVYTFSLRSQFLARYFLHKFNMEK